jgi:alkanesulfonate monooxygenase SsuD/methylene tetrahydromethanopterin reductase-like flavin-dependent oxidoreductase (luciferase family)
MRVDVILSPDLSPAEITELGLLAEQSGISAVWASNYPSSRDPFIALGPLAVASRKIRLGPLVITPYELHPLKISKALFSLNELAGGRAQVLIGGPTGLNGAMGMRTTRMVGMVRETMEILKAAGPDKAVNYHGRIFQVWGYRPNWATASPPLIYVGANKPQMLAMATRVADAIMIGDVTPEHLATAVAGIDQGLAAAGRRRADIRLSGLVAWHVREDARASTAEARQQLALRAMLDTEYLAPFLSADECRTVDTHREAFFTAYKNRTDVIDGVPDAIIDKLVANLTCSGTAADVDRHIERLRRFGETGLTDVALKLHGDSANHAAAIRLIGERVVPALDIRGPLT